MATSRDPKGLTVSAPFGEPPAGTAPTTEGPLPCPECFPGGWPGVGPGPVVSSVGCEHGMWLREQSDDTRAASEQPQRG